MKILVSIVEDHESLRQLLAEWVGQAPDMKLGRTYPDAESALANAPPVSKVSGASDDLGIAHFCGLPCRKAAGEQWKRWRGGQRGLR